MMDERECLARLQEITDAIARAGVELETLYQDELPLWLKGALQEDLRTLDNFLAEAQDRADQVRRRTDRLIAEREGYDGRLRSVGEGLGEDQ
jgi:FtsZ-binding cell division protein ZapB